MREDIVQCKQEDRERALWKVSISSRRVHVGGWRNKQARESAEVYYLAENMARSRQDPWRFTHSVKDLSWENNGRARLSNSRVVVVVRRIIVCEKWLPMYRRHRVKRNLPFAYDPR
jgi:hypothetical protein